MYAVQHVHICNTYNIVYNIYSTYYYDLSVLSIITYSCYNTQYYIRDVNIRDTFLQLIIQSI